MLKEIALADLEVLAWQAREHLQQAAAKLARPVKIYIHWTGGRYDEYSTDFHINIGQQGQLFISTEDLNEYKLHTHHRNSGAVAIAATCCHQALSPNDLGTEPPTEAQIESIAETIAMLSRVFDIPIDDAHVMTHAEAADNMDGDSRWHERYGMQAPPTNAWDFWVLTAGEEGGSGGRILRGKGIWYYHHKVCAHDE